jgi:hypothetical protein
MKKKLTALLVALGLAAGIGVIGAPAANAYTLTAYKVSRMYYASPYCYASVWVDYNWFEESWAGGSHRDYRSFYTNADGSRTLYNCGNTPLGYILNEFTY